MKYVEFLYQKIFWKKKFKCSVADMRIQFIHKKYYIYGETNTDIAFILLTDARMMGVLILQGLRSTYCNEKTDYQKNCTPKIVIEFVAYLNNFENVILPPK